MKKEVVWLNEISKNDVAIAGGKGANLAEMYNAGFPIPPAFIVTAQAYAKFISYNELNEKIKEILSDLDYENTTELEEKTKKIRELIVNAEIPDDLEQEIIEAYEILSSDENNLLSSEPCFVAVRSSATAEDLQTASFAGQQETFLNVKGNDALLKAIKECWASLFTARATYYRHKKGFSHETTLIAVIVQRMVNSEKSGVMFTINPINNDKSKIVIEAVFGLGEGIVSGAIEPDHYVVDKQSLTLVEKKIGLKKIEFTRDSAGKNIRKELPIEKQREQVLEPWEIRQIAEYGRKLEEHYGWPQDVEWAIESGNIYIVQTRAVTTLGKEIKEAEIKAEPLLKGLGASPGIASGKVKLIHSIDELSKVEKGDILVTKMTNPDMVPVMMKSNAIITDEGGMTCFSGETKVLTNKGILKFKEIFERIKNNEILYALSINPKTLKAEWKKIKNVMKRKSKTIKISVSQKGLTKNNLLEVTPDHKFYLFENRKLIKREIEKIIQDNFHICSIDRIPSIETKPKEDNKKLAYLAGAIFTDGYFRFNSRHGSVMFIQKPEERKLNFINTVNTYFNDVFNAPLATIQKTSTSTIRGHSFTSNCLALISYRKKPAQILEEVRDNLEGYVLNASEDWLKMFLAGIIDGDGSYNKSNNRLHIYCSDEKLVHAIVLACLRLGIQPTIHKNRNNCLNIQIVEGVEKILENSKRIREKRKEKLLGVKLFSAKQLFSDIIDKVNWKGRIKPYVEKNLLIDARKIEKRILPFGIYRDELRKIINSDLRMKRVIKVGDGNLVDVYNIEVEDNHNYVVFTSLLTPVLVANCHAAIVSRELGIPAVVGTRNATTILKDNMLVTVDGRRGFVYEGDLTSQLQEEKVEHKEIKTRVKVKVNCDMPLAAERASRFNPDGIGLVRIEFMIVNGGIHPAQYIREGNASSYTALLVKNLEEIAKYFKDKPIWVRTSDLRTDEYRNLKGGQLEPIESDPMIGWHGIRRALDEPEILKAEFRAIKELHDKGYKNIGVMIPFLINVDELRKAKEIMREVGLEPCKDIAFGVMIETPAACWIIEDLCKEGISFISFGTNDLTQLTLGVDRNNERIARLFNEMHPAVLGEMKKVIETCKRYGVETSICGQAASKPEMAEWLVKHGIDSLSVNIDAIEEIRQLVARVEREMSRK